MTEQLIAITVQAYLNHLERTEEDWCNVNTERNVRRWTSMLSGEVCIAACEKDVLAWACLMLMAVTDKGSDAWQWAERILVPLHVGKAKQQQLGEDFLPIP